MLFRSGFDRDSLYLRLDTAPRSARGLLGAGYRVGLSFLDPDGLHLEIRGEPGGPVAIARRSGDADVSVADVAAGAILELRLPRTTVFGARSSGSPTPDGPQRLAVFVTLTSPQGAELERYPSGRPLELCWPDESFEASHWSA